MQSRERLKNYLRAGYSGLFITSLEEARVESELLRLTSEISFKLYTWTVTTSLIGPMDKPETERGRWMGEDGRPLTAAELLVKLNDGTLPQKSVVLAKDFHLFMAESDPHMIRAVKDCLAIARGSRHSLIVLGSQFKLATELQTEFTPVEFGLPDREQIGQVLAEIAQSAGIVLNGNTEAIMDAASGMTTIEAADAFALAVIETDKQDIPATIVAREKSQCVKKSGILEVIETTETLESMGGCENAKQWILRRRHAFGKEAKDYGLPMPKGIMLVGVSGAGKTHLAKIISTVLKVPLIKLDGGKLFSSLVGSSEANVRSAIATAEATSPCVMLIDELEKAFSGSKSSGQSDGGTSSRVFGTFLQWLNDKTKPVFVVATANDISQLPPEFLRKGRFDELFFVDLPDMEERMAIFQIHLAKRKRDPVKFNLAEFAQSTGGFTGAEIEAVVTDALFLAFDEQIEVQDQHVLAAVRATVPLSKTMGPQIEALRAWSVGRTRRASEIKRVSTQTVRQLS